jgi:N-acetylglucosamine kinase
MSDLFLGVDAGATRTRVAVCNDRGELVGTGVGGSGHYLYVGIEGVARSLQEALAHARFQGHHFKAACFASASLWVEASYSPHYNRIKLVIGAALSTDRLLIENDARAALWGAFSGQPGIACIAGTGAVILARTQDGKVIRVGGWGHILGDEGSAYRISLDAVQAALRAYDGIGELTTLLDQASRFFRWQDPQEVVDFFYGHPLDKREVARFAPVVIAEAKNGDSVATSIVRSNISFLVRCVRTMSEKTRIYKAAPIGGIFRDEDIREYFAKELVEAGINCVTPELPPVLSAVGLAMEATEVLTPNMIIQLKANASKGVE